MAGSSGKTMRIHYQALVAYYLTLAAFFAASFFPESRLWGINWWGYYSVATRLGLLIVGCILPPAIHRWFKRDSSKRGDISNRTLISMAIGAIIFGGSLFYLLKGQTHFLGDGYLLLSSLAPQQTFIKLRNLGSMGLPKLLMGLLSGSADTRALLAYQLTSIVAGLMSIGVLIYTVRMLLESNTDRLLFALSLALGGWALMFFGYVENYAFFAVAVLAYCLVGLLICRGKRNRWWILLMQAITLFFHVFGAALIPSTIYLLVSESELGRKIERLNVSVKWLAAGLAILAGAIVFYYFYSTSFFFRFSFVPPVKGRFTVDGYTLFSAGHLLDFVGLLWMLLPSLPLLLASLLSSPGGDFWSRRESRFLMLASVVALGCAFVFDPKLGMPRDWDLFSFAAIPPGILLTWQVINGAPEMGHRRIRLLMGIGLSALLLFPRVVVQADAARSCALIRNYIDRDKSKTSAARFLLVQYYVQHGETAMRDQLNREWAKDLALNEQFHSAYQLTTQGNYAGAYPTLRHIVEVQPNLHQAWMLLSECYERAGMYDSALYCLRVSDGWNPYNAGIQSDIGEAYYKMGKLDDAEKYFRKSIALDSLIAPPQLGLARIYKDRQEVDSFVNILTSMTSRPLPPQEFFKELVDYYIQTGQFDLASRTLEEGIAKGLDTVYVQDMRKRFPELK